jgi:hypothetical protein
LQSLCEFAQLIRHSILDYEREHASAREGARERERERYSALAAFRDAPELLEQRHNDTDAPALPPPPLSPPPPLPPLQLLEQRHNGRDAPSLTASR